MVTLLCVDEQMGSRVRHVLVWTAGTQGSHRKGMIRVGENEGRLRISAEAESQHQRAQAQVLQKTSHCLLN